MRDRTSRPNAHGPYATEPRSDRAGGGPTTRHLQRRARSAPPPQATAPAAPITPGPTAADRAWGDVFTIHVPVQRAGGGSTCLDDNAQVHALAAAGVAGAGQPLPHRERIAASFGPGHDLSHIRAAVGGPAAEAANAIGATAYATGDRVAFADAPDLHTAAHEAAHVVQQRAGVHLSGGVGQSGDPYEVQADAIADRVVDGQSAADLLLSGHPIGVTSQVQRKGADETQVRHLTDDLVAASPAVASILAAKRALRTHKRAAEQLRASWLAGGTATATTARGLIAIMQDVLVPLHELTAQYASRDRPGLDRDVATALDASRAEIHASLTDVARAVITVRDGAKAGRTVASAFTFGALPFAPEELVAIADADAMLFTLGHLAAPVGWQVPADEADADTVRFAFEACPTGDARPGVCHLSSEERVTLRSRVGDLTIRVFLAFQQACQAEAKGLEKMVKAERDARKLVVDILADVIAAGITVAVPPMSPAAKVAFDVVKKIGKMQLDQASGSERADGEGTKSFLDALLAAMFVHMGQVADEVQSLPDEALEATADGLDIVLQQRPFAARLRALAGAYQEQIDPIGGLLPPIDAITRRSGREILAVRIDLPGGPRLAQVARTYREPTPPRQPLLAFEHPPQHYFFLRWIDETFAPILPDAPTAAPSDVNHLPVDAFLPGAHP